jgi:hypothetical protein
VSESIRLNDWKTNPTCARRIFVSFGSRTAAMSVPASRTRPVVGRSRPAAQCSSVDFPDPDGPITAVNVPAPNETVTSRSARTAVPTG